MLLLPKPVLAAAAADVDAAQAAADAAAEAAAEAADAEAAATGAADRVAGYATDFETYSTVLSEGLESKTLSVVRYPSDLYNSVKWHDGSNFSIADIVMGMILTHWSSKPIPMPFTRMQKLLLLTAGGPITLRVRVHGTT